jgi:diguanylate cyclase (GGDEF)-like protein/PAS domain S-box-containing protein
MKRKRPSHNILALYEAADEVEQLINDLRNKGIAARSNIVTDLESLNRQLREQTYDLILSQLEIDNFEITDVLDQVKRMDKDIPIICLTEYHDPDLKGDLLARGIADVVAVSEAQYSGFILKRELTQLAERRAKRRAELNLHEAERRCFLLLESSRDAIAYIADGMHILANESYVEHFGYQDKEEITGLPLLDMIAEDSHENFKAAVRPFQQDAAAGREECLLTCLNTRGEKISVKCEISPASYEGEPCIQLMLHKNQSSEADAALQEKLKQMSRQCLVTGLANRQHFESEVSNAIERTVNQDTAYAIFYIHLDGFSKKRAKIGVDGIDAVAKDIAAFLKDHFPEGCLLSRFGEDTFAVMWENNDIDAAEALAKSFCEKVKGHLFDTTGSSITLTTSIGIAALNESAENARQILSRAFSACHAIQDEGGNGVSIFVKEQKKSNAVDQTASAQELQKAIDNNLFKILFQPIISLKGAETEFYEVLLRRVSDDGSLESPEKFLATAESAKVATIVDRWVILQSVKALITKRMAGHDTKILINLTSQSLSDKTFLPWLKVALKATRLPPNSVIFQASSNDAMAHLKLIQALNKELTALNCQISLSRFGAEEDLDVVLQNIDPGYVKIDASFTKNLQNTNSKEQLLQLLETVHTRDVSSIMTFVESASSLATLWQLGAHYVQGFYLQPPMETMDYDFSQEEDEV